MHAVSFGCDPQARTLADPAGAVHRGGGGSGGLPTRGRPIWCIDVDQLPGDGRRLVLPEPLPEPVAPHAKQAVAGVPGTPPPRAGRRIQDGPGGLLPQTAREQRRQRQRQHQRRLMGHVPHLAGLPVPAAGRPVAAHGRDCRPSPIRTRQIPGGRQLPHQQERCWTADPPGGRHADGAPALLLEGLAAPAPARATGGIRVLQACIRPSSWRRQVWRRARTRSCQP
jgi:hypothetical protein